MPPDTNDPRIAKLPKWARDVIAAQQDKVERAHDNLANAQMVCRMMRAKEPTRIVVNPYFDMVRGQEKDQPMAYLPDDERIRFHLGDHSWIEVRLCDPENHEGVGLKINSAHRLTIEPDSSNTATLRERKD